MPDNISRENPDAPEPQIPGSPSGTPPVSRALEPMSGGPATDVVPSDDKKMVTLFKRASTKAKAGIVTGVLAFSGGVGDGVVQIVNDSVASQVTHHHVQHQNSTESCQQAILDVIRIAKADPQLAREYAQNQPGLPALVNPAIQGICHGDYGKLLKYTLASPPPRRRR